MINVLKVCGGMVIGIAGIAIASIGGWIAGDGVASAIIDQMEH